MVRRLLLAAAVTLALVACSDDESPDDASYYEQLAGIIAEVHEADTAADEELHDALATAKPAETGDLFSQVTSESADRLEAALGEMTELSPPEEAEAAHEELIAASRAELELTRDTASRMAGLDRTAVESLDRIPEQVDIELRTDVACLTLQRMADEADAGVKLCKGTYGPPRGR